MGINQSFTNHRYSDIRDRLHIPVRTHNTAFVYRDSNWLPPSIRNLNMVHLYPHSNRFPPIYMRSTQYYPHHLHALRQGPISVPESQSAGTARSELDHMKQSSFSRNDRKKRSSRRGEESNIDSETKTDRSGEESDIDSETDFESPKTSFSPSSSPFGSPISIASSSRRSSSSSLSSEGNELSSAQLLFNLTLMGIILWSALHPTINPNLFDYSILNPSNIELSTAPSDLISGINEPSVDVDSTIFPINPLGDDGNHSNNTSEKDPIVSAVLAGAFLLYILFSK